MTKRITLGFSAAIVAVVLLLVGSSLGAYVRAQVEEQEAGAIACGDSVKCSRTSWVMRVINTGTGHGIYGKADSSDGTKAAVFGNAADRARGVWGKSNTGIGVYGVSTTNSGIYGKTNSTNMEKAAVYGVSTGNARGVYGEHSASGNEGWLGVSNYGVWGKSTGLVGVFGTSSGLGWGVQGAHGTNNGYLGTDTYGVEGSSSTSTAVYGESSSGTGVHGKSTSSTGVYGESGGSGHGVHGKSTTGYAGYFEGNVYVDKGIHLKETSAPSTPASGECAIWLDSGDGDLKVKFDDGTVRTLATD